MINLIFFDFETFSLKNNFIKSREIIYNGKFNFINFPVYNSIPHQATFIKKTINEKLQEKITTKLHLNIIPQKGILNNINITDDDISDSSKKFYVKQNNHFKWLKEDSIVLKEAFYKINDFISSSNKTILIAHNGLKFDFVILELLYKRFLYSCSLKNCFMFDTYKYISDKYCGMKSYKLIDLYKESTGNELINAHDSNSDTNALIDVSKKFCNNFEDVVKFSSKWEIDTSNDITHIGDLLIANKLFLNNFATWPSVIYNKFYERLNFLNDADKGFIYNNFKSIIDVNNK